MGGGGKEREYLKVKQVGREREYHISSNEVTLKPYQTPSLTEDIGLVKDRRSLSGMRRRRFRKGHRSVPGSPSSFGYGYQISKWETEVK